MFVGTVEVTLLILLGVILAGPMIAERFRIPGLLGLIFFGMFFGPHVMGWLGRIGLVEDLGTIGLLYLMFLAGVSFNMRAFLEARRSAIAFGLLGFFIPFLLSLWVGVEMLDMELLAAALIGAMWASNTLVAYPDVRAAGLADNRAVTNAVSAGVVADLLSLLVLAVVTSNAVIEISPPDELSDLVVEPAQTTPLWISVPLLVGFSLWALPKLGDWFFVKVGHSRVQRLLFALVGMAAGAALAVLAGVEGIIGAFLAGLGLNRLIPSGSELMDRLDFVGSTIFIPAFLVSIGLAIDPAAFFHLETVRLGLLFTGLVIIGKTVAVALGGWISGFSVAETGLMASLSYGQAASTLAIAQVGLMLGFFEQDVVNGAILAIVFTALATSFLTQFFVNRVPRPAPPPAAVGERVMVDARPSASNLKVVMEFAGLIAAADAGVLIPFTIPEAGRLEAARLRIEEAEMAAAAAGHDSEGVVRVSESFTTGALELGLERSATLAVLTWTGPRFGSSYVFGSDLEMFGERSPIPTVAVQLLAPWNRVILIIGDAAAEWHREDAALTADLARRLMRTKDPSMVVYSRHSDGVTGELAEMEGVEVRVGHIRARDLAGVLRQDDLVVIPSYAVQDASLTDQLRLARSLARTDVAVVAGANRMTLSRAAGPHRTERLVGHGR